MRARQQITGRAPPKTETERALENLRIVRALDLKQLLNDNNVSVRVSGPHGLGPITSWRKCVGVCMCARVEKLEDQPIEAS